MKTLEEVKFELEGITANSGNTWYAVHNAIDDNDDGTGSENLEEAYNIAIAMDSDFLAIVVVDTDDDYAYKECIIKGER